MLAWLQEYGLILLIVCMGIVIFCVLLFSYLNNRDMGRRLDKFGIAIDDLNDEIYKIQKKLKVLEEKQEKKTLEVMEQLKAQTENIIDDSLKHTYEQIDEMEQRLAEKTRLMGDSLSALDVRLQEMGGMLAGNAMGVDEKRIHLLLQEGKSVDSISKELGITKGEVELYLQLANVSEDQKKEKK